MSDQPGKIPDDERESTVNLTGLSISPKQQGFIPVFLGFGLGLGVDVSMMMAWPALCFQWIFYRKDYLYLNQKTEHSRMLDSLIPIPVV